MHFSPLAFAFQIANFLVLLWLLKRWLYAPLLAAIDRRRADLDRAKTAADDARAKAEIAERAAQARLVEIENTRSQLLDAAREDAMRERARIADAARGEAQSHAAAAQARLAAERDAATLALHAEAGNLARELARRLVERLPAEALAHGFEAAFDQWLEAQTAEARHALFAGDEAPQIRTAAPCDARAMAAWRAAFAQAAPHLPAPGFASDPGLGAGFEIDLPGGTVHFSLRAAADALEVRASDD